MGNSLPYDIAKAIEDPEEWAHSEMLYDMLIRNPKDKTPFILIFSPHRALKVTIEDKGETYIPHFTYYGMNSFSMNRTKISDCLIIFYGSKQHWQTKYGLTADDFFKNETRSIPTEQEYEINKDGLLYKHGVIQTPFKDTYGIMCYNLNGKRYTVSRLLRMVNDKDKRKRWQ